MNSYTRAFTYEKPSRLMINTMQGGMRQKNDTIPDWSSQHWCTKGLPVLWQLGTQVSNAV